MVRRKEMGQKVSVVKVSVKSGTGAKGPWTNTRITSDTNVVFSGFDKKLSYLKEGALIELDEVEVNDKGNNILKWHLLEEGTGSGASSQNSGDSPEKRKSIEDQTRAYIIADLFKAEKLLHSDSQVKKLLTWLDELGKPAPEKAKTGKPSETTTKSATEEPPPDLHSLTFADAGKLKTACKDLLKMGLAQIEKEVEGFDLTTEKGRADAWMQIVAVSKKPNETDPEGLFE